MPQYKIIAENPTGYPVHGFQLGTIVEGKPHHDGRNIRVGDRNKCMYLHPSSVVEQPELSKLGDKGHTRYVVVKDDSTLKAGQILTAHHQFGDVYFTDQSGNPASADLSMLRQIDEGNRHPGCELVCISNSHPEGVLPYLTLGRAYTLLEVDNGFGYHVITDDSGKKGHYRPNQFVKVVPLPAESIPVRVVEEEQPIPDGDFVVISGNPLMDGTIQSVEGSLDRAEKAAKQFLSSSPEKSIAIYKKVCWFSVQQQIVTHYSD